MSIQKNLSNKYDIHMTNPFYFQQIVLRNGSQAFGWWAKPPVEPTIKVYIYNVTNADEFLNNGSKPIVEELGPYVYV